MEKKIQIREETQERTESGKQSRTTESGKRVCRRKTIVESGQAASKDMEERSGKRLKKPREAFYKNS